MQKIGALTIISFILLASSAAGFWAVEVVEANFIPKAPSYEPPTIALFSPLNQTYTNIIPLQFNITIRYPRSQDFDGITYSVDDQKPVLCENSRNGNTNFNYSTTLENLTQGEHTLQVFVKVKSSYQPSANSPLQYRTFTTNSDTIHFTVNTSPNPHSTATSPTSTPTKIPTASSAPTDPPTSPTPIVENKTPGTSANPPSGLNENFGIYYVGLTIVAIIVAGLLLVVRLYLKRKKGFA